MNLIVKSIEKTSLAIPSLSLSTFYVIKFDGFLATFFNQFTVSRVAACNN
jgi:hypothetical protein